MPQEIVYTSAPRGLKPGSKGFCTVASTRLTTKPLADRLESLSAYRHTSPPGDSKNPVTFAYVTFSIVRRKYHVLSRIADAGYDYSQRSNKLAHHVALDPNELVSAGPAWLLSQPGFMETKWTSAPHYFEHARPVPSGELLPQVCRRWEQIAGDAGWAGQLARTIQGTQSRREVYLIFPAEHDVLPLVLEAQALLADHARWLATFSTNFMRVPPNVDCRWRWIVAGTDEAIKLRRMRHLTVWDLTKPLGRAPDDPASDAARRGRRLGHAGTAHASQQHATSDKHRADSGPLLELVDDGPIQAPSRPRPPSGGKTSTPRPPRRSTRVSPDFEVRPRRKRKSRWPRIVMLVAALLVVIGAVAAASYWFGMRSVARRERPGKPTANNQHVAHNKTATKPRTENRGHAEQSNASNEMADDVSRDEANDSDNRKENAKVNTNREPDKEELSIADGDKDQTTDAANAAPEKPTPKKQVQTAPPSAPETHSAADNGSEPKEEKTPSPASTRANAGTAPDPSSNGENSFQRRARDEQAAVSTRLTPGPRAFPLDLPATVDIPNSTSSELASINRTLPICSLGSKERVVLTLLHPKYKLRHQDKSRKWQVASTNNEPVGTFEINDDGQLSYCWTTGSGGCSLKRGALRVQRGATVHYIRIGKKAKTVELGFTNVHKEMGPGVSPCPLTLDNEPFVLCIQAIAVNGKSTGIRRLPPESQPWTESLISVPSLSRQLKQTKLNVRIWTSKLAPAMAEPSWKVQGVFRINGTDVRGRTFSYFLDQMGAKAAAKEKEKQDLSREIASCDKDESKKKAKLKNKQEKVRSIIHELEEDIAILKNARKTLRTEDVSVRVVLCYYNRKGKTALPLVDEDFR